MKEILAELYLRWLMVMVVMILLLIQLIRVKLEK